MHTFMQIFARVTGVIVTLLGLLFIGRGAFNLDTYGFDYLVTGIGFFVGGTILLCLGTVLAELGALRGLGESRGGNVAK